MSNIESIYRSSDLKTHMINKQPEPIRLKVDLKTQTHNKQPGPIISKLDLRTQTNNIALKTSKTDTKYKPHNIIQELANKETDETLKVWAHKMSPSYKISLIKDWVEQSVRDVFHINWDGINEFVNKNRYYNFTVEQVYTYLVNNNINVTLPRYSNDIIKWFTNPENDINAIDEFRKTINNSYDIEHISTLCRELNLYYPKIKEWVESLQYKTPTINDIRRFKEENIIFKKYPINLNIILAYDLKIKASKRLQDLIIIRKPKEIYTANDHEGFKMKYSYYYDNYRENAFWYRPEPITSNQSGGKSVPCNNTQVLYNTLGTCWNNSIQSIYAFYLDGFNSILDTKTGEQLYNEAVENGLINYLPPIINNKDSIIIILDGIIKRWKNKRNKAFNYNQIKSIDSECELITVGHYLKDFIFTKEFVYNGITKKNSYASDGFLNYEFFMHLLINVFICKEIYDFYLYSLNTKDYVKQNKTDKWQISMMSIQDKQFSIHSNNDNNLVGMALVVLDRNMGHSTCIVKCEGSKFGNFNNYYDDNFEKIYTIDYNKFRQTLIEGAKIIEDNRIEIIKPKGANVIAVLINNNTHKIIDLEIKQKYMKYKLKYIKLKNLLAKQ